MRRIYKFSPVLFYGILASIFLAPIGQADDKTSPYVWPPVFNSTYPLPSSLTGYGFAIVDNFNNSGTGYSVIRIPIRGEQPFCHSLEDPTCQALAQKYGWWIIRVLPPCASAADTSDCIEGIDIRTDSQTVTHLKFSKLEAPYSFPADPDRNLGVGSGTSLWVDPNASDTGTGYAITVSGDAGASYTSTSFPLRDFAASVTPYRTIAGTDFHKAVGVISDLGTAKTNWANPNCVWTDEGECGIPTAFPTNSIVSLTLHLPNSMTGWLSGRLADPQVNIAAMPNSATENRITVEAQPVLEPMVSGVVPLNQVTPAISKLWSGNFCPSCQQGIWGVNINGSYPNAFDFLSAFADVINNKSTVSIPTWSVGSLIGNVKGTRNCASDAQSLYGLVTTNATAYDGHPPVFDGTSLNYKVGGEHFNADGSIFRGSYDLLLRSSVARCIYGFTSAPVQASVSVTSASGTEDVATTVVGENNGWLHMGAYNFTFSNPTIKVTLTQAPMATSTKAPNSPINPISKVVQCVKGKLTKVVASSTCPAGYKKK